MTTTACDDQFSAEPEPVHQPYDVALAASLAAEVGRLNAIISHLSVEVCGVRN